MKDTLFNELKKLSIEDHEKYISYIIKIELGISDEKAKRIIQRIKSKNSIRLLAQEIQDAFLDIRFENLSIELKDVRNLEKEKKLEDEEFKL